MSHGVCVPQVSWMSPKGEVVADSKGRLHVESRPGMPEGTQALVFEHVAKTDKGEWSCHAENHNYTKSFKMIVNGESFLWLFLHVLAIVSSEGCYGV